MMGQNYKLLTTSLFRSLERLHLAIKACASIGFQESSPTTNEHHASIWNYLNDAQKDTALKLKHYKEIAFSAEKEQEPMYGIKAIEVRERLDRLFEQFKDKKRSDHENVVELWAILSDIQLWMADQEEKK
jgi:hypothetical protein